MTHHIQEAFSELEMIQCTATLHVRVYEWFHFLCVSEVQAPAGSWYCYVVNVKISTLSMLRLVHYY